MQDYEIRDVMNRVKHPELQVGLSVERVQYRRFTPIGREETEQGIEVHISLANLGTIFVRYAHAEVLFPYGMIHSNARDKGNAIQDGPLRRMMISVTNQRIPRKEPMTGAPLGEPYYAPILPTLTHRFKSIRLHDDWADFRQCDVLWLTHADSAPTRTGTIRVESLLKKR